MSSAADHGDKTAIRLEWGFVISISVVLLAQVLDVVLAVVSV